MILEFLIFLAIFLSIQLLYMYFLFQRRIIKDWVEIGIIFSIIYSLYVIIGAWDRVYTGDLITIDLQTNYVATLTGAVFFDLGYLLISVNNEVVAVNFSKKLGRKKMTICNNFNYFKREELLFAIFILVLCVINKERIVEMLFNFGMGKSYVENAVRSARTVFSGPLALLSSYFINGLLSFSFYKMYKKRKLLLIYCIPVMIVGMYYLTSGGRTVLLFIAVLILVLINYYYQNIKFRYFFLLGMAGVVGMVLLGHLRAANSISGMIELLFHSDITRISNVRSSGEFYNTTGTLFSYLEGIRCGTWEYNMGESYITEILVFIPYFLFQNRPLPLPEQYMRDFHPEAPMGTGHGWFVLNDGFMSFGVLGIAIEMLLFGILLAHLYRNFVRNKDNGFAAVLYSYLCVYMLIIVRGSVLGSVKNYMLEMLPIILLFFISKKFTITVGYKKYYRCGGKNE